MNESSPSFLILRPSRYGQPQVVEELFGIAHIDGGRSTQEFILEGSTEDSHPGAVWDSAYVGEQSSLANEWRPKFIGCWLVTGGTQFEEGTWGIQSIDSSGAQFWDMLRSPAPKKQFTQNSYHNKSTQSFLAQNLRFVSPQFVAGLTIPSFSYFREESSISRYKFCMVASQGCHGGHRIHQPQGPTTTTSGISKSCWPSPAVDFWRPIRPSSSVAPVLPSWDCCQPRWGSVGSWSPCRSGLWPGIKFRPNKKSRRGQPGAFIKWMLGFGIVKHHLWFTGLPLGLVYCCFTNMFLGISMSLPHSSPGSVVSRRDGSQTA